MTSVDWIRLSTSLFDNPKIKVIETYPKGDSLINLWIRLLCMAGRINNQGLVYIAEGVPYKPEMLAAVIGKPEALVKQGLMLFQQLNMIAVDEKGVIEILGWSEHQNVDGLDKIREQTRERNKRYRQKRKDVTSNVSETQRDVTSNVSETQRDVTSNVSETQRDATDKNRVDKIRIEDDYHHLHNDDDDKCDDKKSVTSDVEIFLLWEKNIMPLTPIVGEKLKALIDEVGDAAVEYAISAAVEHGARNFSYVQAVARNYASGNSKKQSGASASGADLIDALYGSGDGGENDG